MVGGPQHRLNMLRSQRLAIPQLGVHHIDFGCLDDRVALLAKGILVLGKTVLGNIHGKAGESHADEQYQAKNNPHLLGPLLWRMTPPLVAHTQLTVSEVALRFGQNDGPFGKFLCQVCKMARNRPDEGEGRLSRPAFRSTSCKPPYGVAAVSVKSVFEVNGSFSGSVSARA